MKKFFLLLFLVPLLPSCAFHSNYSSIEVEKKLITKTDIQDKIESIYTEIDGMRYHYLKAGDGPPLILIHGWVCSSYFWTPVMEKLHDSFTIYSVDMMGHGLSQKKISDEILLTPDNQAEWIIKFMDKTGIDSAYIAGHSMGGETAARIALKRPDKVEKLILIDAIGMKKNIDLIPWYAKILKKTFLINFTPTFFSETMVGFFSNRVMKGKENEIPDWFVTEVVLQNTNKKEDSRALLKATREGLFMEFLDDVAPQIKTKTLCIWGDNDKVVPHELGLRYKSLIKNSELYIVKGAGHLLPVETPGVLSDKIHEFFSQK